MPRPAHRRPPGSAARACDAACASRATSARAARSSASRAASAACRASSALCRSPCARARASASAWASSASSRSSTTCARSASPRARSSAMRAVEAHRPRLVRRAIGQQALQRLAGVLPPLGRLRGRHLERRQLGDPAIDLVGERHGLQPQLARAPLGVLQRRPVIASSAVVAGVEPRLALLARPRRDRRSAPPAPPAAPRGAAAPRRAARDPSPGRAAPSRRRAAPTAPSSRSAAEIGGGLLLRHVPGQRRLDVGVEPLHHRLELADLALLLEHAGQRRLARAAGDDAVRIDHLALERDDGLASCASRARAPARARDPRPPARRRAGRSRPRRTSGRS